MELQNGSSSFHSDLKLESSDNEKDKMDNFHSKTLIYKWRHLSLNKGKSDFYAKTIQIRTYSTFSCQPINDN